MNQREIRFRAWDTKNKFFVGPFTLLELLVGRQGLWNDYNEEFEERWQIMQFTGLLDCKGKEIYEGDLLQNQSGRICQVRWFQPAGCWAAEVVSPVGDSFGLSTANWKRHVEIIGNIFENLELVKKECK
jgi:hypothetical protein